jgi:hypothetical protein
LLEELLRLGEEAGIGAYSLGASEEGAALYRRLGFVRYEQEMIRRGRRARDAIGKGIAFLEIFPFSCRKAAPDNVFLRELIIPFGGAGYVALFEIDHDETVTILSIRPQREGDYH